MDNGRTLETLNPNPMLELDARQRQIAVPCCLTCVCRGGKSAYYFRRHCEVIPETLGVLQKQCSEAETPPDLFLFHVVLLPRQIV
jgi:hypothetical protein